MTKAQALALLPKVGDIRMERPSWYNTFYGDHEAPAEEAVVVEVHPRQLYYRVRFTSTGFHECYKVPKEEEK